MKPAYKWIARTIAALAMVLLLAAIQVPLLVLEGLAFDGCTKYVPMARIEDLTQEVWILWGISSVVNLAVLLLFLWTPIRALTKPALATLGAFAIWRLYELTPYLAKASRCGDARDYDYPEFEVPFYLKPLFFR